MVLPTPVFVPDPSYLDLSIVITLTGFLIFAFDFGFDFLRVAINVASVSEPRPRIVSIIVESLLKLNLSEDSCSTVPSALIKEYLFAVNGKNTSPSSASGRVAVVI